MTRQYLTVSEVAYALGYTTAHVRLLLKTGKLKGIKPVAGSIWLIHINEIKRWKHYKKINP